MKSQYSEYPRAFWTLVLVTFIDRVGGFLLYPFFALYITQRFGVGMTTVGLVFAAFSVSSFAGNAFGGGLIDHFGRRKMIIFSLIATSLTSVLIGLVDRLEFFVVFALLAGALTTSGGPAYDAMTADLLPEEKRSRGFSIMRVALNLAAAIGPAIGGYIASRSYLALFITDAVISLAAAIFVYFTIAESKPAPHPDAEKTSLKDTFRGYKQVVRDQVFILFISIGMVRDLAYVNMSSTLGVYLRDFQGVPEQGYGLLLTLNVVLIIAFQLWITRRTEKRSAMKMMAIGALFHVLGFGLFGFISAYALFMLAIVFISVAEMITVPLEQTVVAKLSPEDMRGRYMAVQSISWGIPLAIGPYLGGLVMDNLNPNLLWYAAGTAGLIAAGGFLLLDGLLKRKQLKN